MARSKEQAQDVALYHMDKLNRANKTQVTQLSGIEELEANIAYNKLSPEEKMRRKTQFNWERDLRDEVFNKRTGISKDAYSWIIKKHHSKMREFHQAGVPYSKVISFIKDSEIEYMNK